MWQSSHGQSKRKILKFVISYGQHVKIPNGKHTIPFPHHLYIVIEISYITDYSDKSMFKVLQWKCQDWETEKYRTASRAAKGAKYLKCRIRQLLLILKMVMILFFPINYSHWCVMRQIKSKLYYSWFREWGFNFLILILF